jgi:hypothetical protein
MTPELTIPTIIDVVHDELWTILVANIPINRPTKGFDVVLIRSSAKPLPKPLRAVPIRPMPRRNKYKQPTARNILMVVLILFFIKALPKLYSHCSFTI